MSPLLRFIFILIKFKSLRWLNLTSIVTLIWLISIFIFIYTYIYSFIGRFTFSYTYSLIMGLTIWSISFLVKLAKCIPFIQIILICINSIHFPEELTSITSGKSSVMSEQLHSFHRSTGPVRSCGQDPGSRE